MREKVIREELVRRCEEMYRETKSRVKAGVGERVLDEKKRCEARMSAESVIIY